MAGRVLHGRGELEVSGNIQKRPNGKWRARHRDAAGREHARHFVRKIDAERWLASVGVAQARGEWLDPAAGKVRLGDWAEQWLKGQVQLKPSTYALYGLILRKQVLPTWSRVPLSAVTYSDVSAWVQMLSSSHLSASSVRQAHRVLSLVLDHAVRDGRISKNPAKGVRLPRAARSHMIFLTHGQVDQLAVACEPDGTLVRVLAYTGIRWGEAAALRVGRVDLRRRRLAIDEATTEVGGRVIFGTPKTHKQRSVPYPAFLTEALMAATAGKADDDLVFTAPGGGVLRNTNFRSRAFDRAKKKLGLPGFAGPRPEAHRGEPGHRVGGERQGGAVDAGSRVGGHDVGRIRGAFHGRHGRRRRAARCGCFSGSCGLIADCGGTTACSGCRSEGCAGL